MSWDSCLRLYDVDKKTRDEFQALVQPFLKVSKYTLGSYCYKDRVDFMLGKEAVFFTTYGEAIKLMR
jgi:hypothetical protein